MGIEITFQRLALTPFRFHLMEIRPLKVTLQTTSFEKIVLGAEGSNVNMDLSTCFYIFLNIK